MKVWFGDLTLDTDTRQLVRGAEEIHLSPKAFDLLALLVDSRPRALSKDDLQQRLWPDTFVTDSNLAGLVAEIRRAIGDDARSPRFVRTVQRFGYAFAGEVRSESPPAPPLRCSLVHGRSQWPLQNGENLLGRDELPLEADSSTVSRRHARIVIAGRHATLEDLESKNGTFLRGVRITTPQHVKHGDEIRLGSLTFVFHMSLAPLSTRTSSSDELPS